MRNTGGLDAAVAQTAAESEGDKDRVLAEYDIYGVKRYVEWGSKERRFQEVESIEPSERYSLRMSFRCFIWSCFIPTGELSNDYYIYSLWRALQRLISATNNVFGTQALLLALGFCKNSNIGLAAATSWVLKDALGKLSRIIWASKFGRRFDLDAKKWRFRSALLFSTGNALEIVTYLFPSYFLISAAFATAFKQMAMLTSSATRNTIYKSFSRNADNIGDITAKGEAQTAVIDILGLAIGVTISKFMNAAKLKIVSVFILLSVLDLFCVYREIKR